MKFYKKTMSFERKQFPKSSLVWKKIEKNKSANLETYKKTKEDSKNTRQKKGRTEKNKRHERKTTIPSSLGITHFPKYNKIIFVKI